MANSKYLNYEGLGHFLEKLDERFAPIQAIVFQAAVDDIAHLPALSNEKAGYMYSIKTGGITTGDFVEGAGHIVADGENVAVVELKLGTYTPVTSVATTDDPKAKGWFEATATSVTPAGTENPKELGWYEADAVVAGAYVLTTDTTVDGGKTYYTVVFSLSEDRIASTSKVYYTIDTVKKWDLMGGVFDLEGRYLEFGDKFPQSPASRMVDGRTFLYMGDDTFVYEHVASPSGRPVDNGYYEVAFSSVADPSTYYNPKQQGLYEETAASSGIYALSEDITVDTGKTYYTAVGTPSTDVTVTPGKEYYTKEEQYKKGGIYEYSTTAEDWEIQSSGGSDMDPITDAEIDELFI